MVLIRRLLASLLLFPSVAVHADVDGNELLEGYDLSDAEVAQLEQGEVLAFSDEEYEFSKRELAADAMV